MQIFLTQMRRARFDNRVANVLFLMSCCFSAVLLSCTSCTSLETVPAESAGQSTVYVSAASGQYPSSRTIISGDNLDKVLWSEKDRIGFYYRTAGSADALSGAELGVYRIYPDETVFTGTLSDVTAENSYDCYAVYPLPESVSGTDAVIDLPAVQDGLYDSSVDGTSCDVMVSGPVSGVSLGNPDGDIPVVFTHKAHAFRIQVPVDRNQWGVDVKKLRVEFPVPVVGKLTVDLADAAAAPVLASEGASSTVWLDLKKALNESEEDSADGIYAWIFTAPVSVAGEIRFTAYSAEGYQSETVSVSLDKELQAGKITPVNLTIPQELAYSSVTLKIGENHLGEDYQTVTVTAPDGARFRNGEQTIVFSKNGTQEYPIEFYDSYDGIDNLTPMKSAALTVDFESEHAIVSCESLDLADFQSGTSEVVFNRDVPYLLYEDFSGATSADGENKNTDMLDANNLSGWSASNYSISAGQGIRMRRYVGKSPGFNDVHPGRVDSPFLTGLKGPATLTVSFDIGGTSGSPTVGNTIYPTYAFGTDTTQGAIAADTEIPNRVIEYESAGVNDVYDGSYTNLPIHKEVEVSATSSDRLSWRAMSNEPTFCWGATAYVYLDNIRVSIKGDTQSAENN